MVFVALVVSVSFGLLTTMFIDSADFARHSRMGLWLRFVVGVVGAVLGVFLYSVIALDPYALNLLGIMVAALLGAAISLVVAIKATTPVSLW